jgi:hypothetical protein
MEDIIDATPILNLDITISRTGVPFPRTALVSINAANFDPGSIKWQIAGVGEHAGTFVSDDNVPVFTLNAEDERYNSIGLHVLELQVKKDGMTYQKNIEFTIVN